MRTVQIETELFEKKITAAVTCLDYGYTVTLFGGSRTHVGAMTMADASGILSSVSLPGHKEQVITEFWAEAFYSRFREPVCVVSGIHYDHLDKSEIEMILSHTNEILENLLLQIDR